MNRRNYSQHPSQVGDQVAYWDPHNWLVTYENHALKRKDCHYRTSPIRYWGKGSIVDWYEVHLNEDIYIYIYIYFFWEGFKMKLWIAFSWLMTHDTSVCKVNMVKFIVPITLKSMTKLENAIFGQKKKYYTPFPKLIREIFIFWDSVFLKIELSPIMAFLRSL